MTDRFVLTVRAMSRSLGLPDYPVVAIPHPLSDNTEDELNAKAEEAVRQCIGVLQSAARARAGQGAAPSSEPAGDG